MWVYVPNLAEYIMIYIAQVFFLMITRNNERQIYKQIIFQILLKVEIGSIETDDIGFV